MEIIITQDANIEPVTDAEVQQFIKFAYGEDASEVNLIDNLIKAVRTHIEKRTGLVLVSKTYEIRFDSLDSEELFHASSTMNPQAIGFSMPIAPVGSIEKVEAVSLDDTKKELIKNSDYNIKGKKRPTIVYSLENDQELVVTLKAGYGSDGTEKIPEDLKEAIRKQVGRWYWYRDDYREGNFIDEVTNIIDRYSDVL